MKYNYFPTQSGLYEYLSDIHKEFDSLASLAMSRHSFTDVQGEQYNAYTLLDFIDKYNERFGKTIIREQSQIAGRNSYLMYFFDDAEVKEGVKSVVQEQKETKQVEDVSEKEEEVVVAEKVPTEPVTTPEQSDIDWDWISTLKNNKYGKQDLEDYANKNFNIKLKKNMRIENMIIDFKKHVGVSVE